MRADDPARLDLRLLRIAEAVDRLGSLGAAAEELGLSQPALSHGLARLGATIGEPLFVRTSRGMRPTPRGAALAVATRRVQAFMREEFGTRAPFDPASRREPFVLAMSDVGELVFLPRLLARLRAEAPATDLRTVSLPPRRLAERLEEGSVDLAIGYFPDLAGAAIAAEALFERDYLCLAARDHPRFGDRPLTLAGFLAEPHLVVSPESRVEELFERTLRQAGHRRRVLLSVPHFFAMPMVIRGSDLVATVSRSVGDALSPLPGLRLHELPLPSPRIRIGQFWATRFGRDPAQVWLRGLVATLFREAG